MKGATLNEKYQKKNNNDPDKSKEQTAKARCEKIY